MSSRRRRVWNPGYLALCWIVAVAFSGVSFGVALEGGVWSLGGIAWTLVPLLVALRVSRSSVEVTEDEVLVRNVIATYRVPRNQVTVVSTIGYNGFWTRGVSSGLFATVQILTASRTVAAYGLAGRSTTVKRRAAELHEAIGLEARKAAADDPPRHLAN